MLPFLDPLPVSSQNLISHDFLDAELCSKSAASPHFSSANPMASRYLLLALSALSLASFTLASTEYDPPTETTFYSEPFVLAPGEVFKDWYPIEFPEGHLGIRSFNAELVDEDHNPVPLNEAYLHHWTVRPFLASDDESDWDTPGNALARNGVRGAPHGRAHTSAIHEGGEGLLGEDEEAACESGLLKDIGVWFGVGSETRHTNTSFPAPYAAEIGNPDADEVVWKAQIHAIGTLSLHRPFLALSHVCYAAPTQDLSLSVSAAHHCIWLKLTVDFLPI